MLFHISGFDFICRFHSALFAVADSVVRVRASAAPERLCARYLRRRRDGVCAPLFCLTPPVRRAAAPRYRHAIAARASAFARHFSTRRRYGAMRETRAQARPRPPRSRDAHAPPAAGDESSPPRRLRNATPSMSAPPCKALPMTARR